jgi:hypothetical protein
LILWAYDEQLDSRVADVVTAWGATWKAMFGEAAYMLAAI